MSEAWLQFSVVILVQLIFFVIFASYQKRLPETPKILLHGVIIGIILGLLYDNLLGRYFGIFSYTLGFEIPFLLTNAALSYGLFVASTLLLQKTQTSYFIAWMTALIVVYETTNYFFPVWMYEFSLSTLPLFVLYLAGYSSGALLASVMSRIFFKYQFVLNLENTKR